MGTFNRCHDEMAEVVEGGIIITIKTELTAPIDNYLVGRIQANRGRVHNHRRPGRGTTIIKLLSALGL